MTQMMNEMFSKEILAMFNMDIVSFSSVFGWLASEGYVMITLLLAMYFSILGGTILLKEQDEKTIYFLYSKPVSKRKILTSKILTGLIYILFFNLVIGLTNFIGLYLSDDLNIEKWLWISIMPAFLSMFCFFISLFISLYMKKTNASIGVNLGLVFMFYIMNVVSMLSDKIEFLKYFSPFYYIDARDILMNGHPEISNCVMISILSIGFMVLSYYVYDKKEVGL